MALERLVSALRGVGRGRLSHVGLKYEYSLSIGVHEFLLICSHVNTIFLLPMGFNTRTSTTTLLSISINTLLLLSSSISTRLLLSTSIHFNILFLIFYNYRWCIEKEKLVKLQLYIL